MSKKDGYELLAQTGELLSDRHDGPWLVVWYAAQLVLRRREQQGQLAQLLYEVVKAVPALRDKELVTAFRCDRRFNEYVGGSRECSSGPGPAPDEELVVTLFPRSMPAAEVARRVHVNLEQRRPDADTQSSFLSIRYRSEADPRSTGQGTGASMRCGPPPAAKP